MRLLEDEALEEGEEYEFIPIEPPEPKGAAGPDTHSTLKKKLNLLPLPWQKNLKFRVTGASTDPVCLPIRDEEQTGYLS